MQFQQQQPMQVQQLQPMQFQQQQPTVVMMQQPVAVVAQPQTDRDWSTELHGCCTDCESCIYAGLCYPCFVCTLSTEMGECGCGPIFLHDHFLLGLRTKLRTKYNIRGSILNDCCTVTFCGCCAAMQMHRELKHISRL